MTNQEVINFLNQVRKILLDEKSWLESTIQPVNEAFDMAIKALEQSELCNDDKGCSNCMYSGRPTYKSPCSECRDNSQWEMKPISRSHENGTECEDTISRQEAIEAVEHITSSMSVCVNTDECHGMKRMQRQAVIELANLPSVQPEPSEITDVQAILHLQSTGWMQNHDREIYGSGLREQLAYDSGSYDSLIPCEDTISRQTALDALAEHEKSNGHNYTLFVDIVSECAEIIRDLPSAQPEIIRCKECKNIWYSGMATIKGVPTKIYKCDWWNNRVVSEKGFCFMAERKTDD